MTPINTIIVAGAAVCMAASVVPGALAQATMTSPPAKAQQAAAVLSDSEFVEKASSGNWFEIDAGQLALAKATDAKLKDFGRMMVMDHTAALKKLEDAARAAGTPVKPTLAAAHQAKLDALKALSGVEFDRQYKADMKQGHADTLALLTSYKKDGKSEKLRAWAIEALPTVLKHRDAIDAM